MEKISLLSNGGSYLGRNLIKVIRKPVDAGYSDKEREGQQRPAIPGYLYGLVRIEINSARKSTDVEGSLVLEFNDDPNLQFPLTGINSLDEIFPKASGDNINKAILLEESTGESTYFVDDKLCTEQVLAANVRERKKLVKFMEEINMQIQAYTDANNCIVESHKREMSRMGLDSNITVININN